MPPKFQSSFIPKSPVTSSAPVLPSSMRRTGGTNFISTIGFFIFLASVLLAMGVFGYKVYLQYRIDQMSGDLSEARAALDPGTISELTRLNDRIVSTKTLVSVHQVITPLLTLLETSTPISVRFTDFQYTKTDEGLEVSMSGEARGYTALALQAEIFNNSRYFTDPTFSNLTLNEDGDVIFSFKGMVSPELVSYYVVPVAEPPIEDEPIESTLQEESNLLQE